MTLRPLIAWLAFACTPDPDADGTDADDTDADGTDAADTDTDTDTDTADDTGPGQPVAIGGSDAAPSHVRVCADGGGAVYALWADDRRDPGSGAFDLWLNRSDDGQGWRADPVRVSTVGSPLWDPQLACDGASVTVAWEADRDNAEGNHQIYVNHSDDGGVTWFGADVAVDDDPDGRTMSIQPSLAALGDEVVVVFADDRNGAYDVFAVRSGDAGRTWRSAVRLDSDAPAGGAYSAEPRVAFGPTADDVYAVWSDTRDGAADVRFTRSDNGGTTFEVDVRLDGSDAPGAAGSYDPRPCASGDLIAVVWQDERRTTDAYDVYAAWSDDRGATWGRDVRLDEGTASSALPTCLFDGGTAHVAWTEGGGATTEVAATSIVDGAPSGVVATVSAEGAGPQLAADAGVVAVGWIGADGAFAARLGADGAARALGGGGAPAEIAFAVRDGVGYAAWASVAGPLVGSAAL